MKLKKLQPTDSITIIYLNDYFCEGADPETHVKTVAEFIEDDLDGDIANLRDMLDSSGDGTSNFVVCTIINNIIQIITE